MITLICFALKEEAALFRKIAADKPDVAIIVTGVGRKNAEKSLREFLATHSPELVLTCGFAGGLNPDLKPGEVVFETANAPLAPYLSPPSGERVSARTGEGFQKNADNKQSAICNQSEPPHVGCYEKLAATGAKPAKFFCADRIVTTVAEKKKLRAETGADAVEMESEAIHAVCRERGIPCATVRVISDTADEDLPLDFNALFKSDMSLDCGKLAWAIARS